MQQLRPLIYIEPLHLSIPVYNLMLGIGLIAGFLVFDRLLSKTFGAGSKTREKALLAVIPTLFVGFLGARLLFLFLYSLPVTMDTLLHGGLVFYGAFLGVILYVFLLKVLRVPLKPAFEAAFPAFVLAHAIGRIGCFLGGCCYGRIVSVFSLRFQFPTQLTESAFLFILFVLLVTKAENRWAVYLTHYPAFRFLVEFLRGDDRGSLFLPFFSPAQVISLAVLIAAVVFIKARHIQLYHFRRRVYHESRTVGL
jgi:phosphatidylglycerol:prolipoprotein diacylglycerol transferase